jgi:hypothetical protein
MAPTEVTRLTMPTLLLFVAAALLPGCPSTTTEHSQEGDEPVRVLLAREFKLRVGQRAAVEGEGLRIRFASVANDSRCPADVTCVWAGNAEVLIEAESGGSREGLKLNTHGGAKFPKESRHKQYSVGLVALSPHPRTDRKTKATGYVATLVIRKQ